jgi:hypothetical protein
MEYNDIQIYLKLQMSMELPNSNLQTVPYFHSLPRPTNIVAAELL